MSGIGHKFIAVCVLAFWLVATQHCGLEAAGVLSAHADEDFSGCCATAGGCAADDCATVEDGAYRSDTATAAIAAPQLSACVFATLWDITAWPPEFFAVMPSESHFERPLAWIPRWQFVQRAALLPGAPSFAQA